MDSFISINDYMVNANAIREISPLHDYRGGYYFVIKYEEVDDSHSFEFYFNAEAYSDELAFRASIEAEHKKLQAYVLDSMSRQTNKFFVKINLRKNDGTNK